jgi:hypothetical protein
MKMILLALLLMLSAAHPTMVLACEKHEQTKP